MHNHGEFQMYGSHNRKDDSQDKGSPKRDESNSMRHLM
jgi:hypothetical protein